MGKTSHKLQRILKTVNIEVRHRSSNKLHSSLHTHKDRKHKNTQPGVYKIPCECGKVYIGETGRSFNTRIKEHKACQRLGDGDKSAIVKHAQQQQHKINWEDSSLITSIPHWHTRRVRQAIPDEFKKPSRSYNTTQFHKIAGYTSTTSGILSCRKGRHQPTQPGQLHSHKTHHQELLHPGPQPTSTSSRFTHVCNQHTSHLHLLQ